MPGDWIRLYRAMMDHPVFQNDWLCRLFIWCLFKANYQPSRWHGIDLEPGQFITGKLRAAEELGVAPTTWYRGMKKLAAPPYSVIDIKADHSWTIVTVCKYRTYQYQNGESGPQVDHKWTTSGPQVDTDKEGKKERRKEGKNKPLGEYTQEFLEFWDVFPPIRKTKKPEAFKAWQAAITRASPDSITEAAKEFALSVVGKSEFCPGPAPWLNQSRWEDDHNSWWIEKSQTNGNSVPPRKRPIPSGVTDDGQ